MFRHLMCGLAFLALAGGAANAGSVEFSPDGKQIVFARQAPGGGLHISNADGSGVTPVPGGEGAVCARWSPNGQYLLFVDAQGRLLLMNAATHRLRTVADKASAPLAWREDTGRFAAICTLTSKTGVQTVELCEFEMPTGDLSLHSPLPATPVSTANADFIWLPNTDDIAFLVENGGGRDVYLMQAGQFNRLSSSSDILGLGWLAQQQKLIWARRSPNLRHVLMQVYVFDVDKRSVVKLNFPERVALINPDGKRAPKETVGLVFSPNGRQMALTAVFDVPAAKKGVAAQARLAAFTLNIDGTNAHLVQQVSFPKTARIGGAPALALSWSAAGDLIAIQQIGVPKPAIVLCNADGTGGHVLPLP